MNEKTGEMIYGIASNLREALPNASFIGFTGTLIEKTDANTYATHRANHRSHDANVDFQDFSP